MRAPRSVVLAALVAAHLGAPSAAAQQDSVAAERPLVPGGAWDKPYLTTLLGRTALGGYAEAHARLERVDGATERFGFEAKRFNLFTATRVSDFVRIGAELEIEEAGEEIALEYAAVDLLLHPAVGLRAGMILVPLGRFNLAHDSPRNAFTDRPLVATELLGVALSDAGFGLLGRVPLGGAARLGYEAYGVNGFGEGLLLEGEGGVRIPAGERGADEVRSPAWVGRVAASPRPGWELGLSGYRGTYTDHTVDGLEVDDARHLSIAVVDLELDWSGVRFEAEAARAWIELPRALRGLFASGQAGVYVEAVRPFGLEWISAMPGSRFEAKARLEGIDLDTDRPGDDTRQLSLGLNFRPTSDTALKLDWVRGRARDRFENASDRAAVLLSVATYF